MSARIADVLIPLALDTPYSYRVSGDLGVAGKDSLFGAGALRLPPP